MQTSNNNLEYCNTAPEQDVCNAGELNAKNIEHLKEVKSRGWCNSESTEILVNKGLIWLSSMEFTRMCGTLISYSLTPLGREYLDNLEE